MPPTITMACNIYQEGNAVHGLLESASQFFDEVFFFHTGPNGRHSTDGTIEAIEKWHARLEFGSIDDGFGAIRTELIRRSRCDWVMILDADERFYPMVPLLNCEGHEKYPDVQAPNLKTTHEKWLDQGAMLRDLLTQDFDVIRTCRRHWFDHTWKRPCQNFRVIADWQCRVLKNNGRVGFNTNVKMHEQLTGAQRIWSGDAHVYGPYHDHFHCHYKPMEPEQRKEDIAIYDALHEGRPMPPPR